jgi:hypothetical protein
VEAFAASARRLIARSGRSRESEVTVVAIETKPPEITETAPVPVAAPTSAPTPTRQTVPALAWVCAGIALASIWVCIEIASAYAPDFVSGSQHEHLQLVAGADWIWGLVATSFVVLAAMQAVRSRVAEMAPWMALAIGTAAIWIFVALVSVFSPVWVTGTDPTIIPANALGVPILGVFLTWFLCTFVKSLFEQYKQ